MNARNELISFLVVPGPKGLAEAKQRFYDLGFEQVESSCNGRMLHVVASRGLLESVLGFSLVEKRRSVHMGEEKRTMANLGLPDGVALPQFLRNVVAEIIFSVTPDYFPSSSLKR